MRFLHYWPYALAVKGVQCKMMKKPHQKIIGITAEKAYNPYPHHNKFFSTVKHLMK